MILLSYCCSFFNSICVLWQSGKDIFDLLEISITFHGACILSCFSHLQLFPTLWTVTHPTLLSMGFSSQEYWSGLPCPPPGDLSYPGIEPACLMSPALAGGLFTTSATWAAQSTPVHDNISTTQMRSM